AVRWDVPALASGYTTYGQLGDGTTTDRLTPVPVSGLTGVTQIAAGGFHSLAVRSNGTAVAWGSNSYGELGDGTTTTGRSIPVAVSGLTNVARVSVGYHHSVALRSDGTV